MRLDLKARGILRKHFIPVKTNKSNKGVEVIQDIGQLIIVTNNRELPDKVIAELKDLKAVGIGVTFINTLEERVDMLSVNKKAVIKAVEKTGAVLGCWDNCMDLLSRIQIKKVIDSIGYGSTDVDVVIKRKPYIVEISELDNEIDFNVLSKAEYIDRYGDERWDEE